MSNIKFQFYQKSEKNKNAAALIYVFFTLDRRYKVSLNVHVLPKWWDNKLHRAIVVDSAQQKQVDTRNSKRVNRLLNYLDSELTELFEKYKDWDKVKPNIVCLPIQTQIINKVKEIIARYHSKEQEVIAKKSLSPTEFFQQYIDSLPTKTIKRTGTMMQSNTINNHKIVLKRYTSFLAHYKLKDSFELFNSRFESKLESYLLKGCNYAPNTVCATNSILKVWLGEAEREGLLSDTTSYRKMKSKGYDVEHVYLTDDEIMRLYAIQFTPELKEEFRIDSKSTIEQSRDLFIIACKTGLRLGDLNSLNYSTWNLETQTLIINTHKTQRRVVIPLSPIVIDIYNKYQGKLPKPADKSHYNRHIKLCSMIAGIDGDVYQINRTGGIYKQVRCKKWEMVTSHTARRSFATNMYLKSRDARMVMALTGHTTEENFMKYICVSQIENAERARQYI